MLKRLLTAVFSLALLFPACSSDDDSNPIPPADNTVNISYILPSTAPIGDLVQIHGSNFGTDTSRISLTMGGVDLVISTMTDTDIYFIVPEEMAIAATQIKLSKNSGTARTIQFTVDDPIIRNWVSQGTDVAPYLYEPPLHRRKITANFSKDGSFTIRQTDSSGFSITSTGSYIVEPGNEGTSSSALRKVRLQQGSPDNTRLEGIYQVNVVDGAPQMKLEIIEVNPPRPGVTPPTIEGGFGSSGGGSGGRYTQQYYRN